MLYFGTDPFIDRERVSNEYSHKNPLCILRDAINRLYTLNSDKFVVTLEIIYYDLYNHTCIVELPGEEYPFRQQSYRVVSLRNSLIVRKNDTVTKETPEDIIEYFANTDYYKISNIFLIIKIGRRSLTKVMYACDLRNVSYKSDDIRSAACQIIQKRWREHYRNKEASYLQQHKRKYEQVTIEILCLPSGGYTGGITSFTGGKLYNNAKKRYKAVKAR